MWDVKCICVFDDIFGEKVHGWVQLSVTKTAAQANNDY